MSQHRVVLAIDPGTTESGFVVWDVVNNKLRSFGKLKNPEILELIQACALYECEELVIEMCKSYGNPMGDSILETCVWIGRFIERWETHSNVEVVLRYRKSIVAVLCHNSRAGDSNVRQYVIDYFRSITPADLMGGGKTPVVGLKSKPGPLFGFADDMWQAMGLALGHVQIQYDEMFK